MPYPDDYAAKNAPDSERVTRSSQIVAQYEKCAGKWSEMRDMLAGLAQTIRDADRQSAAYAELADLIDGVVSDADGFCAIDMLDSGDEAKVQKAIAIWDAFVRPAPTAAEILRNGSAALVRAA